MASFGDFADTIERRAILMQLAYGGLEGIDLVRAVLKGELAGRVALVSSFGADAAVMLHMVAEIAPATPVIFLDTGQHFDATLDYCAGLTRDLGLTDLRVEKPDPAEVAASDPRGDLWARDASACCEMRKVRPLAKALETFDCWLSGRRRYQLGQRVDMPGIEADATHIKINPLAGWAQADINAYYERQELTRHPLYEQGYLSIGCRPCTQPTGDGVDSRAGRWAGGDKTECGIHVAGFDPTI